MIESTHRVVEVEGLRRVVHSDLSHPSIGRIEAVTAFHENYFTHSVGGVRLVGQHFNDYREVRVLAQAMTYKCALARIPADGQKTVVYCGGPVPPDDNTKAEIVAAHIEGVRELVEGPIFGPDMACGEGVIDRLAHHHDLGEFVTGLPAGRGGLSIDLEGFTASGLTAALLAYAEAKNLQLAGLNVTVQGFGAVGAHTARLLAEQGMRVVAVSTRHGCLHSTSGLDVQPLFEAWRETQNDENFKHYRESPPAGTEFDPDPDRIFKLKTDIFVPAARTDVLCLESELGDLAARNGYPPHAAETFLKYTGVRLILEGANGPLTTAAEEYFEHNHVTVLPDYLVNHGGLVGCWLDWVYRDELEGDCNHQARIRLEDSAIKLVADLARTNVKAVTKITAIAPRTMRAAGQILAARSRESMGQVFNLFEKKSQSIAVLRSVYEELNGGLRSFGGAKN